MSFRSHRPGGVPSEPLHIRGYLLPTPERGGGDVHSLCARSMHRNTCQGESVCWFRACWSVFSSLRCLQGLLEDLNSSGYFHTLRSAVLLTRLGQKRGAGQRDGPHLMGRGHCQQTWATPNNTGVSQTGSGPLCRRDPTAAHHPCVFAGDASHTSSVTRKGKTSEYLH